MSDYCSWCHKECVSVTQVDTIGYGVGGFNKTYRSKVSNCCEAPLETEQEHAWWLQEQEEAKDGRLDADKHEAHSGNSQAKP